MDSLKSSTAIDDRQVPTNTAAIASVSLGPILLGGLLLLALFAPTLLQLLQVWSIDANYSHGYFILPLSLGLAWRVVREHPMPEKGEPTLGMIYLGIGVALHLAGVVIRFLPVEFLAMVLVLHGTVVVLGGREWARRFLFPIWFLIFLFPLPAAWTSAIAVSLQDKVAAISAEVLGWFFHCFRRGNNILIAGVAEPMFVAQECSGVRQIMAFVAMAALLARWKNMTLGRGLLVVLLAVPVAIATNVVRVILMGLGLVFFGHSWFTTWMHHVPAAFTIPLGILCFWGLVWVISPDAETPNEPANESAKENA